MRRFIPVVALCAVVTALGPFQRASAAGVHHASELAGSVRIVRTAMPTGASSVNVDAKTWSARGMSLREVLSEVYGIEPARIDLSGAAGLELSAQDRFDITLPLRGDESDEVIRAALERALATQLDLRLSFENRTVESYVLTAPAGTAARLRRQSARPGGDLAGAITVAGQQCPGVFTGEITAHAASMADLAGALGDSLDRPVIDETGLAGSYDFHIPEYRSPEQLFQLLQQGLGITVTRAPRSVEVLSVRSASQTAYELRTGF